MLSSRFFRVSWQWTTRNRGCPRSCWSGEELVIWEHTKRCKGGWKANGAPLLVPARFPRDSVPQAILAPARASLLATCTRSSVPIVKTSAPCTAVACLDFALTDDLYDVDLACPRFLQTRIVLFGTPLSPTSSLTWRSSLLTSFCCVSSVPPELSVEPIACIELGKVVHRHCLHVVEIVVDGELHRISPCRDRSPVHARCLVVLTSRF